MGRKYKSPPILEAVCEFKLSPDTPWDLAIPGLFYEEVKDEFVNREQRTVQEVELTKGPQGLEQRLYTTERILFSTEDRRVLVQLGPRLLVVNALRPYPGWQKFKPKIELAWHALQRVVAIKGLQRIGLRYINHVEIPDARVNVEEYFDFYPFVGDRLPQQLVAFIVGSEFAYEEGRDYCRVQLYTGPSSSLEKSTFILDIDYSLAKPLAVDVSDVLVWVEVAHDRVQEIFEGCITDRLRALFEEVK